MGREGGRGAYLHTELHTQQPFFTDFSENCESSVLQQKVTAHFPNDWSMGVVSEESLHVFCGFNISLYLCATLGRESLCTSVR